MKNPKKFQLELKIFAEIKKIQIIHFARITWNNCSTPKYHLWRIIDDKSLNTLCKMHNLRGIIDAKFAIHISKNDWFQHTRYSWFSAYKYSIRIYRKNTLQWKIFCNYVSAFFSNVSLPWQCHTFFAIESVWIQQLLEKFAFCTCEN